MPTYEFRCPDGHVFDRFYRKMSDAASELPCPVCGKPANRQLSGGAGLVFKGSGFYLTDYGKNAHRGDAGGKAKPETSSETSPSEKQPESKSSDSSSSSSSSESKPTTSSSTSETKGDK